MGCAVNGPGEAREADVGIAGGMGEALLFRHGEPTRKVQEAEAVAALVREAEKRGQSVLNLGLGIDGGISFFKKKWDAYEAMPHLETSWAVQV